MLLQRVPRMLRGGGRGQAYEDGLKVAWSGILDHDGVRPLQR